MDNQTPSPSEQIVPQPHPEIDASEMPSPHLQLRWAKPNLKDKKERDCDWVCHYELIVPLDKHDVRAEKNPALQVSLGRTKVSSSGMDDEPRNPFDGALFVPFRDGCHIAWDGQSLKLPGYVVWGDRARLIFTPEVAS